MPETLTDERVNNLNVLLKMFDCGVHLSVTMFRGEPLYNAQVDASRLSFMSFEGLEFYVKGVLLEEQELRDREYEITTPRKT